MVFYGEGDSNVWDKPLYHKLGKETNKDNSNTAINNTATITNDTTGSTIASAIGSKNFDDQLSFMKQEFNIEIKKIATDREASAAQANELKEVKGNFDKSLSEFRS